MKIQIIIYFQLTKCFILTQLYLWYLPKHTWEFQNDDKGIRNIKKLFFSFKVHQIYLIYLHYPNGTWSLRASVYQDYIFIVYLGVRSLVVSSKLCMNVIYGWSGNCIKLWCWKLKCYCRAYNLPRKSWYTIKQNFHFKLNVH